MPLGRRRDRPRGATRHLHICWAARKPRTRTGRLRPRDGSRPRSALAASPATCRTGSRAIYRASGAAALPLPRATGRAPTPSLPRSPPRRHRSARSTPSRPSPWCSACATRRWAGGHGRWRTLEQHCSQTSALQWKPQCFIARPNLFLIYLTRSKTMSIADALTKPHVCAKASRVT